MPRHYKRKYRIFHISGNEYTNTALAVFIILCVTRKFGSDHLLKIIDIFLNFKMSEKIKNLSLIKISEKFVHKTIRIF